MTRLASALVALAALAAAPLAHAGANLMGKVSLNGTAPEPKELKTSSDPNCAKAHPDGLKDDHLLVKRGGVQDVVVFVSKGLPAGGAYAAPAEAAKIDQKGCMYRPKVVALRVGQPLQIANSDPTFHNVHETSRDNGSFNLAMMAHAKDETRTFQKPEIGVKLRCDVHPWMAAYVAVFDHPYFQATGEDGRFEIRDLPAGTYAVETWHATLGTLKEENVTVADGDTRQIKFAYDPRK